MNILFEIIGYGGTALVLLSMLMTSMTKLRFYNLLGSVLSMVYAYSCAAWPVFLLNLCLTAVNSVQLYRLRTQKEETV